MRDISQRIQRRRLTRFAPRHASLLRRLAWAWPILGLWAIYVLFVGEHSLLHIWRMSRETAQMRAELASTRKAVSEMEARLGDPRVMRDRAEHVLREKDGFARRGEIIYRIPSSSSDTLSD